jgi:hypothetical protein
MYESEFAALARQGVAERYWLVFVESLEALVVGAVLYLRPTEPIGADDPRSAPLSTADYEAAFEVAYRCYVVSLLDQYRELSQQD